MTRALGCAFPVRSTSGSLPSATVIGPKKKATCPRICSRRTDAAEELEDEFARSNSVGVSKPNSFCAVAVPVAANVGVLANGLYDANCLRQLRGEHLADRPLALRLCLHLPGPCFAQVPSL